ncbi:hypothetical protein D3C78_1284290 [compost metagenome]
MRETREHAEAIIRSQFERIPLPIKKRRQRAMGMLYTFWLSGGARCKLQIRNLIRLYEFPLQFYWSTSIGSRNLMNGFLLKIITEFMRTCIAICSIHPKLAMRQF